MMRPVFRSLHCTVLLLACGACTRPAPPPRDPTQPDLRLERVAIRSWSGDRLRVVTTATRLDLFREVGTPGDVVAHDAGVLLVSDGTRLRAPLVTGNLFSGQFLATGGVRLEGPAALRASTPSLAFERSLGGAGLASSDAGVLLTQPGLRLEANGFAFDVAEDRVTFDKVKTDFALP